MKSSRIGIAMSGGVDSTATALFLQKSNNIHGFFMRLSQPDFHEQKARVDELAARLAIPLHVVDLRNRFSESVLEYFSSSYFSGTTPNPCVICNQHIKFGELLDYVLSHGMDAMATGHYARVSRDTDGYHLLDGLDDTKNQSYFLSRLSQQQLAKIMFPLGGRYKTEIYEYVTQHGFTHFQGQESQDICFLGKERVADYLAKRHPHAISPGPIRSTSGDLLGTHDGLFRYTIGQRRGLRLPDSSPWYVSAIDCRTNTLVVGKHEALFTQVIQLNDIHWIAGNAPDLSRAYTVRIRYSHRGAEATISMLPEDAVRLTFKHPQRAVTPGQFAVIYSGHEVLGSGVIAR